MHNAFRHILPWLVVPTLVLAACGADDAVIDAGADGGGGQIERPTVVVTTTVLGDVVEELAGEQVEVVTILPAGADPHDFQASAQQANRIREADALIANGGGLEAGLLDVIESAEEDGVPMFEVLSAVGTIEFGDGGHADGDEHAEGVEHADDEHAGEGEHAEDGEHGDGEHGEDEHGHEGADPHFFQDPASMAVAAEAIGDFLADTVEGIDSESLEGSVATYVGELEALDAEVEDLLSGIEDDQRVLVTNHDAFGYFAERYGFEVVGTVIPSGSTADGASAGHLAELAETVRAEGVPAVFAENTTSGGLADTLAAEVGEDVSVVELFSGSLGEEGSGAETYAEMMRTNAQRIADALA